MEILHNVILVDEWAWKKEKNEIFSVKSCYEWLEDIERPTNEGKRTFHCNFVWEPRIPTNVKFFMWSLMWGRILTVDMLQKKGIQIQNRCCLCKTEEESMPHLFLKCRFTMTPWENLLTVHASTRQTLPGWYTVTDMLQSWKDFNSREVTSEIWAILPYALLWTVWRVRNEVIFQGGTADEYKVIQRIKATIWGWLNIAHMAKVANAQCGHLYF
ncbi:Reverse transcriptase zinc-binding domain [Thalictrum thalictroides]|uniref:Reverse transcriptase zinc-binding domain n=1 Tax=Thalictrum thalictroides TaxID=46969 RepID=A0A7J6WP94_THATH|nr:Reverse transcriptase zinc-binding domain [Thalictrum thalictroides]